VLSCRLGVEMEVFSYTVNTLEGSLYYQGNQTVDNYLDSFLTLVSDARYTDPWTLVVKFHCHTIQMFRQNK